MTENVNVPQEDYLSFMPLFALQKTIEHTQIILTGRSCGGVPLKLPHFRLSVQISPPLFGILRDSVLTVRARVYFSRYIGARRDEMAENAILARSLSRIV